jgi:hypothetical protein
LNGLRHASGNVKQKKTTRLLNGRRDILRQKKRIKQSFKQSKKRGLPISARPAESAINGRATSKHMSAL